MTRACNADSLDYTASHFMEVARQNRFAENASVPHDISKCLVCNPALAGEDPFPAYLEVIARSVLVRRPKLDEGLVAEMNGDRKMTGLDANLTVGKLLEGGPEELESWAAWVREALAAGLGLLSIHSPTSLDFDLDEQEEAGHAQLIESTILEIMGKQRQSA